MNRPRLLALVSIVFFLPQIFVIQAQAPQPPPAVTFQTEVNYVDVDAIVTDQEGKFISDLRKDDFEIFEDGKPQKIDTFSLVEIPLERQQRFLVLNRSVTSDARTNARAFAGRVYVIVLDDLDVSLERSIVVRRTTRQFIEQYFGANDMAAVVYTSGRTDAVQEFTNDPRLLVAAVEKFTGRKLRSAALELLDTYYQRQLLGNPGADDSSQPASSNGSDIRSTSAAMSLDDIVRGQRALAVLDTLKNLPDYLATVRGRRKSLLLFSEGIDYPLNDIFGAHTATDIMRATQDAITAAARANVNFFTIDPRGLIGLTTEYIDASGSLMPELLGSGTGDPRFAFNGPQAFRSEMTLSQDSLRTLADETGGFAAVNTNALTSSFDRIVESNSRYYVIGYYPPNHPRDGKFHKIEVRVRRPGVSVLARKGYASARGKTPEEQRRDDEARRLRESRNGGADNTSVELRTALNSPMQQSGLTFSAQAAAFRNTNKDAAVALAIDIDGSALQFTPQNNNTVFADSVELSLYGMNEQGKPQRGTRSQLNLTLRPETYQRVKAAGVRFNPRITLAPGRYQIRIAARETGAGRLGSVFYDLQVPDFSKEPLMVSGLLISASSARQAATVLPDPVVAKMLPGPATSRRSFARGDTLSVLAELYDNIRSQQVRQIDTSVQLIGEDGREVFAARDTLENGSARSWTAYGYTRDIPLRDVAPGRYLLRVEAAVRGRDATPVSAETVISVE